MADAIKSEEQKTFDEHDFDQQPTPDIVAYNELRSCADLFRMHDKGIALDAPQTAAYVRTKMEHWAQAVRVSGAKAP